MCMQICMYTCMYLYMYRYAAHTCESVAQRHAELETGAFRLDGELWVGCSSLPYDGDFELRLRGSWQEEFANRPLVCHILACYMGKCAPIIVEFVHMGKYIEPSHAFALYKILNSIAWRFPRP